MPLPDFIGMAVSNLMKGAALVNDESGDYSDRYLDVGWGLKIHMPLEIYGEVILVVGDKCTRREARPCVSVWEWIKK